MLVFGLMPARLKSCPVPSKRTRSVRRAGGPLKRSNRPISEMAFSLMWRAELRAVRFAKSGMADLAFLERRKCDK